MGATCGVPRAEKWSPAPHMASSPESRRLGDRPQARRGHLWRRGPFEVEFVPMHLSYQVTGSGPQDVRSGGPEGIPPVRLWQRDAADRRGSLYPHPPVVQDTLEDVGVEELPRLVLVIEVISSLDLPAV